MPKPSRNSQIAAKSAYWIGKIILILTKLLEKQGFSMGFPRAVIFLLMLISGVTRSLAQPINNACANAYELCPGQVYSGSNVGATASVCPGCEDDFNFCFPTDNTVWYSFTTNAIGGDVQVDIFNLVFETNAGQDNELQATLIEVSVPCNSPAYVAIGNCVSNATGNFTLNAAGLAPNTTYYLVIDGDNSGVGITSAAECSFELSISGTGVEHPTPVIDVNQSSTSICLGDVVYFEATLTDCPDNGPYNWYVNGVLVAVTADSIFQTSGLNSGDIVQVETSCYLLCPEVVSVNADPVSVLSFPVYAGEDILSTAGTPIQLTGQTTALNYNWSPTYLFSDPFSLNPICTPTETVTITLTANMGGCTISDYLTITIEEDLLIPNTFSPNGDLINDTWDIKGIEKYPNNAVSIYDRWGQQVFQTTGYSKVKAWDGVGINRMLSEGVYFYVLDLESNGKDVLKGTITLIL